MISRLLFFCLYFLVAPNLILAQTESSELPSPAIGDQSITLQEAIEYSMAYSPTLVAAQWGVEAQRQAAMAATREIFFPTISGTAGVSLNQRNSYNDTLAAEVNDNPGLSDFFPELETTNVLSPTLSADVAYPIIAGGRRFASADLAQANYNIESQSYQLAIRNLVFQTVQAYFSLYVLREAWQVQERALEATEEVADNGQANYDAGVISLVEYSQLRLAVANLQPAVSNAYVQYVQGVNAFLTLIGRIDDIEPEFDVIPIDVSQDLNVDLQDFNIDLNEALERALTNRPEIQQAAFGVDLAAANSRLQTGAFIPTISIFGRVNWSYTNLSQPEGQNAGLGAAVTESRNLNLSVGAQLTYNFHSLIPGSPDMARQAQANAQLDQSRAQRRALEDSIRTEVVNAYVTMRQNIPNLASAQEAFELADETLSLAEQQYEAGLIPTDILLDSQVNHRRAELTLLQSQFNLKISLITFLNTIGEDLTQYDF